MTIKFCGEFLYLLSYVLWVCVFFDSRFGPIHPADGLEVALVLHLIGFALGANRLGGPRILDFLKKPRHFIGTFIFIWFLYSSFWAYTALLNFWALRNGQYDLGIFSQTLQSIAHGDGFLQYVQATSDGSFLKDHQAFLIALFAPFFWTPYGAELLVTTQPFLLYLPGLLFSIWIYFFGFKNSNHRILAALFFFISWIQAHPLVLNFLWDWHETTLTLGFLTLFTWALFQGRPWVLFFAGLCSGLTKEYHFLVCAAVLFLYPFFHGIKVKRNWIFSIGSSIFFLTLFIFIQKIYAEKNYSAQLYSHLGTTPFEILQSIFLTPQVWLSELFHNERKLDYFFKMNFYTGFLSLLSGFYFLVSVPIWLIHLLSQRTYQTGIEYHYSLEVWAFISVIAFFTLKFIQKKLSDRNFNFILLLFLFVVLIPTPKNAYHVSKTLQTDVHYNKKALKEVKDKIKEVQKKCEAPLIGVANLWTFSSLLNVTRTLYSYDDHAIDLNKKIGFQEYFMNPNSNLKSCLFFIGTQKEFDDFKPMSVHPWTEVISFHFSRTGGLDPYKLAFFIQ